MRKIVWVLTALFLAACGDRNPKPKPEAAWQREAKFTAFLQLSTAVPLDSSRKVLDTLLAHYAPDSAAIQAAVELSLIHISEPTRRV